jgi:hypothetical protein
MNAPAFYDRTATTLVNAACSEAVSFLNALAADNASASVNVDWLCRWSADAVAPGFTEGQRRELAQQTKAHVLAVSRALRVVVAA